MTKGKYASRSDNRTTAELQAENARLSAALATVRMAAKADADLLRLEVSRLRADIMVEASKLAAPEVARRMEEIRLEHEKAGLTVEIMRNFMARMDMFAMNACRYISMKTGEPPLVAMDYVITWITGEDFKGVVDIDKFLLSKGLPVNGFMATAMKDLDKFARRRYRDSGRVFAFSLDTVESHLKDFDIHPGYDPKWYGQTAEKT